MTVVACNCMCCQRFKGTPMYGEITMKPEDQRYKDAVKGIRQSEVEHLKSQLAKVTAIARELVGFYGDKANWKKQHQVRWTIIARGDIETDGPVGFGGKLARAKLKELDAILGEG